MTNNKVSDKAIFKEIRTLTVSIVHVIRKKAKISSSFCVVNSFCKTINSLSTSFTMQKLIENGMTHFCVYFSTFFATNENAYVATHKQISFKIVLACIQPE